MTWHDLFPFGCVSSTNQIPETAGSGEPDSLEHRLFGQARPVRRFISLMLPGQRAFLRNSFLQSFFFFAPSNILFKRKWDVYLLFPYFFSGKQRVVDFLPLPSLPSFFPKVLIWEKENEVLFLFSFLSHLKHCPCEFFKFLAICTREKEGAREGEAQRERGSGKALGLLQPFTRELVSHPCNRFYSPSCAWDGYCCGHLQQPRLDWV